MSIQTAPETRYGRKTPIIDGKPVSVRSGETIPVYNPSNGQPIAEVERGGEYEVDLAVKAARAAFDSWRHTPPLERGRVLQRAGQLLEARKEEFSRVECEDAGKPLRQATVDVTVAIRYFEYYAGFADKLFGRTIPLGPSFLDYTVLEPHGVCGIITPWNYPLAIACRSIVPALAVGNTIVFKPAEAAPLTSMMLVELLHEAGLPAGVINVVPGRGREAGEAIVEHPDVDHISFTGSVKVGQHIMERCARHIRPLTLELGGKSPHVVFDDADRETALPIIMNSIYQHAGQTCTAGSRLLVQENVYEEWLQDVIAHTEKLSVGDAADDFDLGPLVSEQQLEGVSRYVEEARAAGARVVAGGRRVDGAGSGWFYSPTVIADADPASAICQEEVFGPVLVVLPFKDEAEAINLANGTEYGLAAGVWSRNVDRCVRTASEIRAGQVYVNNFGAGGGVELPTGGFGKSGFGREKGLEALLAFTNTKNVSLKLNG
jgi:aldehyde dehydrogenase (NAD+)